MSYNRSSFSGPRSQGFSRGGGGGYGRGGGGGFSRGGGRGGRGGRVQKSFDPSHLVRKAIPVEVVEFIPKNTFADFNLTEQLHKNITDKGYLQPTEIQDQAIPQLMSGKDVIGLANTGTGKTAAFLIPLIHKVAMDRTQQVLIVAPTRELAVQIEQEFRQFAFGMNILSALCIGGVNMSRQVQNLRRRPQFVIGTPGRLRDLEHQRVLNFVHFNNIVLDEVDQMLNMGFINEVRYITSLLKQPRQSLFFSATMPDTIRQLTWEFLKDPITIAIKSNDTTANIDQDIVHLEGKPKIEVLDGLLRKTEFEKVLVFLRTKHGAEKLYRTLYDRGVAVAAIHGDKNQNQRQRAIQMFKRNQVQVLLATDVASRGLDIDSVTHVINFDLPETHEDYIHRIGRTGRAGKKGIALTLVD